jgi:predicted N-acetyltransferase YhbS
VPEPINISCRHLPDSEVDDALDAELRALLCACFTKPEDRVFETRRYFTEPPAHRWLALDGERLVGHVAAHDKQVGSTHGDLRVLGVAEVCVAPTHRRMGLTRLMLEALHQFGVANAFDFAVLFGRAELYASSGYLPITNTIRVTPPEGPARIAIHEEAMCRALSGTGWPKGPIDLRGPVF